MEPLRTASRWWYIKSVFYIIEGQHLREDRLVSSEVLLANLKMGDQAEVVLTPKSIFDEVIINVSIVSCSYISMCFFS